MPNLVLQQFSRNCYFSPEFGLILVILRTTEGYTVNYQKNLTVVCHTHFSQCACGRCENVNIRGRI